MSRDITIKTLQLFFKIKVISYLKRFTLKPLILTREITRCQHCS